jgi:iron complex outermembrane receptor protein
MSPAYPTLPAILVPALSNVGSQDYVEQSNTAKAVFGQAIYGITDDLHVTFGVRHSWEEKDYLRDPTGTLITPAFFTSYDAIRTLDEMKAIAETNYAAGFAFKDGYDRQRTTFKAGFDYKFNDAVMAYFNFAEGYKGGGYGARAASRRRPRLLHQGCHPPSTSPAPP